MGEGLWRATNRQMVKGKKKGKGGWGSGSGGKKKLFLRLRKRQVVKGEKIWKRKKKKGG